MRRRPSVRDARELCNRLGARGVIVLAFDGTAYAAASYGQTKAECAAYGKTLDEIADAIDERLIRVHVAGEPAFATERSRMLYRGEPMLQYPQALISELRRASYLVAMETNGTIAVPTGFVDWLTVSPKHLDDRWVQRTGSELKIVYPAIDPEDALARCSPDGFAHLFVQPEDGPRRVENQRAAVDYVMRYPRWRISAQVHKFLDLP